MKEPRKSFGKLVLFLVFGFIILNLNFGNSFDYKNKSISFVGVSVMQSEAEAEAESEAEWIRRITSNAPNSLFKNNTETPGAETETEELLSSVHISPVKWALDSLNDAITVLVGSMGIYIDEVLSPKFFDALVRNNPQVYLGWVAVRDLTNIFFILLLLFSAFATIFQIEKYHLRKMIIMLVIMALLVNFSFPIARFIIDFSNSAMYFIIDATFQTGKSATAEVANFSNYGALLAAINNTPKLTTTGSYFMTLIFNFIVLMTFLSIWINLLIRILAFMILIILSPVGFVFAFFPDTKSIANDWWSALFKYALMGPIMVFFLYLAMVVFKGAHSVVEKLNFAGTLIAFMTPIVFLWMGLIAAQKFGGRGSGVAMNLSKRIGNKIKGYSQKMALGGVKMVGRGVDKFANATGVPGAIKQRYAQFKTGVDRNRENREAKLAALLGTTDAKSNLERKRYEEEAKKMKNFNNGDLETKAKDGNIAAADELLNRKALKPEVFAEAIRASNDIKRNDDLTAKYKGANKDNRVDIVASIDARKNITNETRIAKVMSDNGLTQDKAIEKILEDDVTSRITKMNQKDFISQDFEQIYKTIDEKLASGNRLDIVEGYAIRDAIHESFEGLKANGADKDIIKNLSKNQTAELNKYGVI